MELLASAREPSSAQDGSSRRDASDPPGPVPGAGRSGEASLPASERASEPRRGESARQAGPQLSPLDALGLARSRGRPSTEPGADGQPYAEIEVAFEPGNGTHWCRMKPAGEPSFTPGLLADLGRMQDSLRARVGGGAAAGEPPLRYCVLASGTPDIFSLGTARAFVAGAVRDGDDSALRAYARACVDVLHTNAVAFDGPVVTIALVEGEALGFGFEAALSCDVVVAERNARFGFPEIGFNLFPGMGAYSFLSRRIGGFRAEEMILSGHAYAAEELHALGLVQVLAEPGGGRDAVEAFIERNGRRHNAQSAIFRVGREVDPVSREELLRVADLWVEAALAMSESDLRRMEAGVDGGHAHSGEAPAAAAG